MNVIKRRLYFYSAICCFSLMMYLLNYKLIIPIILLIFLGLLIKEFKLYRMARLIMDNEILHIQSAKNYKESIRDNDVDLSEGDLGIYISCFGVLLDTKVIKYNIDEIRLIGLQVDYNYLTIVYKINEEISKIRILYGNMEREELECFTDRFSHETGIVPVIRNEN